MVVARASQSASGGLFDAFRMVCKNAPLAADIQGLIPAQSARRAVSLVAAWLAAFQHCSRPLHAG